MITTYKGYDIRTTNFGGGETEHTVNGQTFTSMMAAMNYVDTLLAKV